MASAVVGHKNTFFLCSAACNRTKTCAQKIYNYFILNGLRYAKNFSKADIILIDTCAFCQETQDRSLDIIGYCGRRKKRSSIVIVIGCLPTIDIASLQKFGDIYAISSNELEKLDGIINATIPFRSIPSVVKVMSFPPS